MPVNPYAPPATAAQPPLAEYFVFKSTTPLARAITIVLLLYILEELLHIVIAMMLIKDRGVAAAGEAQGEMLSLAQARDLALMLFLFLVGIAATVLFCLFMPRANRNARWFRSPMSIGPRWAAGFFFIPIVNFWKPYQAMREIWRGSDPDPSIEPAKVRVSWLLPCWWALYLISYLPAYFSWRANANLKSPADHVHAAWVAVMGSLAFIASAVAAIALVRAVARRQDQRRAAQPAG